jgi:hypothetical protein
MKKLLAGTAVAIALATSSVAHADPEQVLEVQANLSSYFIETTYYNWCLLGVNDPGANAMYATAVAAKSNHWTIYLAEVQQVGQTWNGPEGPWTCDYVEAE